ncbi:MAG TPA: hypothetical protein VN677_09055 [Gemmatimonadaceae bacterium]|nr:hypothetical protein [Gemmatimonadaceae bacterium]
MVRFTGQLQGGGNAFIVDAPARDWTEAARRASLVTVQRLSAWALQVRYA